MISEPTQQPLKIRDLINVFSRQRISIIIIMVLAVVAGFVTIKFTKPIWQSSTQILVEAGGSGGSGGNQNNILSSTTMPTEALDIPTQIQILQSANMLVEAFRSAGVGVPEAGAADPEKLPVVRVDQVKTTNVLSLSVESPSAELVQSLTVVIPQVYLSYVKQRQQGTVESALRYLSGRIDDEKDALKKAETALNTFTQRRALFGFGSEPTVRTSRFTSAEDEAKKLQTSIAGLETRIASTRATLRRLPKTVRAPVKQTNPEIFAQKSSIAQLRAKRDALLGTFYKDYPDIKNLDAEIMAQERVLRAMPEFVQTESTTDNPEIRNYESTIAQSLIELGALKVQLSKVSEMGSQYQSDLRAYQALEPQEIELKSNVELHKNTIANVSRAYDDLRVRRNSVKDPVSVLTPPTKLDLVRPKKAQTLAVAILLGIVFAVSFALFKDALDDRLTSADEVYSVTGLPSLGQMPALPKRAPALAKASVEGEALEKYQMLRFNLLFTTLENPVKSIVVTSTNFGEGKTELACNLAVAASGEGRRVILVDANLRNPSIHKKMNVDGKPGLTDVVLGLADLEGSLHPTSVPGLMVLTCGSPMLMPAELLSSEGMKGVFNRMQDLADLVIFDAPSVSGTADAQILSNLAESVVYVGKVGSTRRAEMRKGLDSLRQARARILGVALSGGSGASTRPKRRSA